jgi:hypothetical protein
LACIAVALTIGVLCSLSAQHSLWPYPVRGQLIGQHCWSADQGAVTLRYAYAGREWIGSAAVNSYCDPDCCAALARDNATVYLNADPGDPAHVEAFALRDALNAGFSIFAAVLFFAIALLLLVPGCWILTDR